MENKMETTGSMGIILGYIGKKMETTVTIGVMGGTSYYKFTSGTKECCSKLFWPCILSQVSQSLTQWGCFASFLTGSSQGADNFEKAETHKPVLKFIKMICT